jgi:hypothetical protein
MNMGKNYEFVGWDAPEPAYTTAQAIHLIGFLEKQSVTRGGVMGEHKTNIHSKYVDEEKEFHQWMKENNSFETV